MKVGVLSTSLETVSSPGDYCSFASIPHKGIGNNVCCHFLGIQGSPTSERLLCYLTKSRTLRQTCPSPTKWGKLLPFLPPSDPPKGLTVPFILNSYNTYLICRIMVVLLPTSLPYMHLQQQPQTVKFQLGTWPRFRESTIGIYDPFPKEQSAFPPCLPHISQPFV